MLAIDGKMAEPNWLIFLRKPMATLLKKFFSRVSKGFLKNISKISTGIIKDKRLKDSFFITHFTRKKLRIMKKIPKSKRKVYICREP